MSLVKFTKNNYLCQIIRVLFLIKVLFALRIVVISLTDLFLVISFLVAYYITVPQGASISSWTSYFYKMGDLSDFDDEPVLNMLLYRFFSFKLYLVSNVSDIMFHWECSHKHRSKLPRRIRTMSEIRNWITGIFEYWQEFYLRKLES